MQYVPGDSNNPNPLFHSDFLLIGTAGRGAWILPVRMRRAVRRLRGRAPY